MSVLTTPRTTPATPATPIPPARAAVHHRTLTPLQQHTWNTALARAEAAADRHNIDGIKTAHALAAAALGIHLPDGAELAMCECGPCPDDCDLITDRAAMAEYLDGTGMQRLQCTPCTSDHRHTGEN